MRTPVLLRHVCKSFIIAPALYLTLLHYTNGRPFALVALGRNQGSLFMHSYADRYTHDFFFERDYPAVAVLEQSGSHGRKEPT